MFMIQRRGLEGMLRHRARHVLLPLALAMLTILPVSNFLYDRAIETTRIPQGVHDPLVSAVLANDGTALETYLPAQANWIDPVRQWSILHWTALSGHPEMVEALLQAGADIQAWSSDGETALLAAAAFANDKVVEILLAGGSDRLASNHLGRTPRQHAVAVATTMTAGKEVLGLPKPDESAASSRRERCDAMLADATGRISGKSFASSMDSAALRYKLLILSDTFGLSIGGEYFRTFSSRVFDHLWFLCLLVWLVAGFAVIVKLGFAPTGRWICLIPLLTLPGQWLMTGIGPDPLTPPFTRHSGPAPQKQFPSSRITFEIIW